MLGNLLNLANDIFHSTILDYVWLCEPIFKRKENRTVESFLYIMDTDTKSEVIENDDEIKSDPLYPGNFVDNETLEGGHKLTGFNFPDPFILLCFFDKAINEQQMLLHRWQMDDLKSLGRGGDLTVDDPDAHTRFCLKPSSQHPYKYCLIAANGAGKDKFIVAPFAIWFSLTKIRSRCIITTSSGAQLTGQTEPYIKDLAEKVNAFFGYEVYRIRQRYIKCMTTGSEIRLFATDEAGKAEGYHPIDADGEMAIIENEAKSILEAINKALRRCRGFNYWLKVSSAGEPKGHFYQAATTWKHVRRVTSYECPHVSVDEIESDKLMDGEHSAFFRSTHLSLFTSLGGSVVIPMELVEACVKHPPDSINMPVNRIGIDLAAGGAENALYNCKGNKVVSKEFFREKDTTITADKIERILIDWKIPKDHQHIYADDGGVGRAIIDMLVRKGWNISRIMNQWAALGNKKQFGNRGAENWYRVARIIEERLFDLTTLDEKTREQLYTRQYKQSLTGGKIFLQDKREAIAAGFPSPDRADAFILSQTGLTIDDYIKAQAGTTDDKPKKQQEKQFTSQEQLKEYYEEETFKEYNHELNKQKHKKVFSSLRALMNN